MRYVIEQDDYLESPRDWDNVGKMVCWHSRYTLGDEQPDKTPAEYISKLWEQYATDDEVREVVLHNIKGLPLSEATYKLMGLTLRETLYEYDWRHETKNFPDALTVLPLYLYDHSGITMNTTGFYGPWDSGQVGFIYAVTEDALKETPDVEACLRGEVATYSQYLEGDVWSIIVKDDAGEVVESLGGIYGREYAEQEAKAMLESLAK